MRGFEWAENNLDVDTPQALQAQGVNVFFAPNIRREIEVVNLADGRVEWFHPDEEVPESGYYADKAGLERYCLQHGIPLNETNGQMSTLPAGFDEAGDPARRGHT